MCEGGWKGRRGRLSQKSDVPATAVSGPLSVGTAKPAAQKKNNKKNVTKKRHEISVSRRQNVQKSKEEDEELEEEEEEEEIITSLAEAVVEADVVAAAGQFDVEADVQAVPVVEAEQHDARVRPAAQHFVQERSRLGLVLPRRRSVPVRKKNRPPNRRSARVSNSSTLGKLGKNPSFHSLNPVKSNQIRFN